MPNYKYLAANLIDIGDDTTGEQRRLRIGKNNDLALYHYASNSHIENLTGNLVLENKSTTGKVQIKLGTTTANTDFEIVKSDGTSVFNVDGSGGVSIPGNLTTSSHSTNTQIKDLIIELGNGREGDPSDDAPAQNPTGDCGIVMIRGDTGVNNAFMGFDDSENKFIMGTGEFTGATSGHLEVTPGTLQVAGITRISTDEAHDLTIALAGNTDSSLVLSSTGTGADALQVTASAGGMDISSVGAIGMDTVGTAAINIGTGAAAKTITMGHDDSAKVDINALAIELDSAGTILANSTTTTSITSGTTMTLSSGGALAIDTVGTDAINIGTEAAAKTITIGNDNSTKVDINALAIELDSGANGVTINSAGAVDITSDTITMTSANQDDPLVIIKNTTNDANGARLRFVKDKGAAGADGDDIGIIEFVGDDAAQAQTTFAKIVAEVSEADNTDEAGKLSFFVAESDGTTTELTAGLVLEGEHATDGQVDVTIGAGAASTTTIAGTLSAATGSTIGNLTLANGSITDSSGAISFGDNYFHAKNIKTSHLDNNTWKQLGSDIDGEATGDKTGYSIDMSANGKILAIGAPVNAGGGHERGHVRIYEFNETSLTWSQKGSDINGEANSDHSGFNLSLSGNGNTVCIGARYNDGSGNNAGHARIYRWNGSAWTQLGSDIDADAAGDRFGFSNGLSFDGNTVVVGADFHNSNKGQAKIFDYNGSAWVQRGSDIDGDSGEKLGLNVRISSNGNIVALGAQGNDDNGTDAGVVKIYYWNGSSWIQRGSDIQGAAANDITGHGLSLSANGNIVALGDHDHDSKKGHVRIFKWDGSSWTQLGSDIQGDAAGDEMGHSVRLSYDGTKIVVGAQRDEGSGTNCGQLKVFQYDGITWNQIGSDINGVDQTLQSGDGELFGHEVTMSADGNIIAGSALFHDSNRGTVRVYRLGEYINDLSVGGNISYSNTNNATLSVSAVSGTDVAGKNLTIAAGQGTGTGAGGNIVFQTADGGTSGTGVNSLATAMTILDNGNVGINKTSPVAKLHIDCGAQTNQVIFEENVASFPDADTTLASVGNNSVIAPCVDAGTNNNMYIFWRSDDGSGEDNYYFANSGTAIAFTGQHKSYSGNPNIKTDDNLDNYVGLIIKSLGIYRNDETDDITINNAWPVFSLCNSNNDKSVYGVITNRSDSSIANDNVNTGFNNGMYGKLRINSLGEGSLWVCNKNGSLDNGDYISSTTVTGYGGKQSDDLLHNYTVAKITCDCNFDLTKVVKRRIKLVDDPTGKVISFDSQGNIEYEDILDEDGNIQMVYEYETRFLQADGTLLTDEADYQTRLANGETVYIACFVGCTYHCG